MLLTLKTVSTTDLLVIKVHSFSPVDSVVLPVDFASLSSTLTYLGINGNATRKVDTN